MSDVDNKSVKAATSRWNDLIIRLASGVLFAGSEFVVVAGGASWVNFEVILFAFAGIHELLKVVTPTADPHLGTYLRSFPYAFFAVFLYFLNGDNALPLIGAIPTHPQFHGLICYSLSVILVLVFVIHLNEDNRQAAFQKLVTTLCGCVVIAIPTTLYTKAALSAVFWFWAGASVIVYNDSAAYFCGRLLGRKIINRELIKLSPKKTWEGFIGALIITCAVGTFQPLLLAKFPLLYCPRAKAFDFHTQCEVPDAFVRRDIRILGLWTVNAYPAQVHGFVLALFGSLIAPFGGFLASGLKRCYNVKDFGNLIPGHGGILDRMDCQLAMGSFLLLYVKTFNLA
jgi:phosphatidate cytidylyltransferase